MIIVFLQPEFLTDTAYLKVKQTATSLDPRWLLFSAAWLTLTSCSRRNTMKVKWLVGCSVTISTMCAAFTNGLGRRTGVQYAKLQQYQETPEYWLKLENSVDVWLDTVDADAFTPICEYDRSSLIKPCNLFYCNFSLHSTFLVRYEFCLIDGQKLENNGSYPRS